MTPGAGKFLVLAWLQRHSAEMPQETPRAFSCRRLIPLALLLLGGALFIAVGGRRYLSFEALAAKHDWACALVSARPVVTAICFIGTYAGLAALSVPGAALLTIVGGVLFGAWFGAGYSVFAATIGATIVFVAARAGFAGLLTDAGPQLRRLEAGFHKHPLNYLLVLRLVPAFPFWLVNLVAGATGMRLPTYLLGTFFGMMPAAFVYASLGSGLGSVIAEGRRPDFHVLSRPQILLPIVGLALLALMPVFLRRWREARER